MSMKDVLEGIERKESYKPKLAPEQYIQDIILATKGYYSSSENESNIDIMKRIASNITGCDIEYISMSSVNHWMYNAFEWLIGNGIISDNSIRDYILGTHDVQTRFLFFGEDTRKPVEVSFEFLYNSIMECQVTRLNLTLNKDLATESDYIRELERNYDYSYENDYTEIYRNGELIKVFYRNNREYFDMSKEVGEWVELQCKDEYEKMSKDVIK